MARKTAFGRQSGMISDTEILMFSVIFLNIFTFFSISLSGATYGTISTSGVTAQCTQIGSIPPVTIPWFTGTVTFPNIVSIASSFLLCAGSGMGVVLQMIVVMSNIVLKSPFPINAMIAAVILGDGWIVIKMVRGVGLI